MIKIEVTGQSIAEVADKLLALGASLSNVALVEPTEAAAAPATPKARKPAEKQVETTATPATPEEVGKAGGAPLPAKSVSAETPAAEPAAASVSDAPIDADALKTLVLSVVKTKGRDVMVAILEQFGVAKATDVPAELTGELLAALEGALA